MTQWSEVRALSVRFDGQLLVGAVLFGILAYQCLFCGWLILLWRTGYFDRRHLSAYHRIWWVSYLFRYVPGKVFLLVERVRMGSVVGIPRTIGAALTVIETLLAIFAAVWVSLLVLSFHASRQLWIAIGLGTAMVGILFVLPAGFRWCCRLPIVKRTAPEIETLALRPLDILVAAPVFMLHFLFLGVSFFLCLNTLQHFAWSAFPEICGMYAFSHAIGLAVVIAPGGIGVREGVLSLQLGRIVPHGVAEAVAVGMRLWFTVLELLGVVLALLVCPKLPPNDP